MLEVMVLGRLRMRNLALQQTRNQRSQKTKGPGERTEDLTPAGNPQPTWRT